VVYYDNICNIIVKVRDRFIQNPALQFPAVLHTVSLLSKTNVFEHASEHQRNETSQFCEHTASTQLRIFYKTENQMDWLKKNLMRKNCQKILLTDVAEQIKPVYETNCSRKKNFDRRITTSVPKKFFASEESLFSRKRQGQADLEQKQVEKVYRRIPPHLTYIGILLTRELRA